MAAKQTKGKQQSKARGRARNVKVSDLPVAKAASVKGGDTAKVSTTSTTPTESLSLNFTKVSTEYKAQ